MPNTTRVPGSNEGPEIVKWYTRARHFPQLIGKTPDGATIWGGPYTYTQIIGGVVFIVIGSKTTWLWGHFGLIGNALVLLGAAYGLVLLLGRLPIGSRNPLSVGTGVLRALSSPAQGHLGGGPIRIRRPHRARSRLVIGPSPSRPAAPQPSPNQLLVDQAPADQAPADQLLVDQAPADQAPAATSEPRQRRTRPRWSRPAPSQIPPRAAPAPGLRPTPAATRPAPALTGVQRLLASSGPPNQETR